MIGRIAVYRGASHDPYYNIAVEETLMNRVSDGECILYLWQNAHTVVIGRNQNAWKECRTGRLEEEGGKLARRLSGGGAVYHDLGNLNFTFLVREADYDVPRQLAVIVKACRRLGIAACVSGRNDILAEGNKFSGNAFYRSKGRCYHHGTLMVDVDMDKVGRYLSPSKAKLEAKGVDSVRSRVVNLREFVPRLTCAELAEYLIRAFEEVYGHKTACLTAEDLDRAAIERLRQRNASRQWLYGRDLPFNFSCERRFSWGELGLCLHVDQGRIRSAKVYSDAMDWSLAPKLEQALMDSFFTQKEIRQSLAEAPLEPALRQDIIAFLAEQEI